MKIKLFDPHVGKAEENAVKKILHSKSWASGAGGGKSLIATALYVPTCQIFQQSLDFGPIDKLMNQSLLTSNSALRTINCSDRITVSTDASQFVMH